MSVASASTSIDVTAQQLWRAGRGPLVFGLVLVALGVLTAILSAAPRGSLDPRAADRTGSGAVAELLRAEGVTVELVQTRAAAQAAGAGDTLLVAVPDRLGASQLAALKSTAADVVLVRPDNDAIAAFAAELEPAGSVPVEPREPRCDLPGPSAAGSAEVGDRLYRPRPGAAAAAVSCYPVDGPPEDAPAGPLAGLVDGPVEGAAALVQVSQRDRTVTVLGASEPLTNEKLAEHGNAALVLRLLGANDRLVWYLPALSDVPAGEQRSFVELVPPGWWWGSAQLAIGVVLLAAWRARRLGPVVAEPLPVIVRATETVEGRARLYRRAGARDRAAAELREATIRRLIPVLGLPRAAQRAAVVDALAARTGQAAESLGALLYGPAPDHDDALIRLATSLDGLEQEVRRP